MLPKPAHIERANIADTALRFRWDEWNVTDAYQPADPELMDRMAKLSHRANVALCTAMAEWVVWRFERLSADPAPHEFLEAAWASGIHTAYARYADFDDEKWRGVVRGPIMIALEIVIDLVWGFADTKPGENVAWMSNLAELVLTDPQPFRQWREGAIARLEPLHPLPVAGPGIAFSDEAERGTWVPRETFSLAVPFDPAMTRMLLERFLKSLNPAANSYLHTTEEVREFPDFAGVPYELPAAEA